MRNIALFGGTFDPIHNGHIQTSLAITTAFDFDSYLFLPCKTPTMKPPAYASNQQRIEMIQLAIKPYNAFALDLREMNRDTPSYMVHTLTSLKEEHPSDVITLILGYDAFLSLPKWHEWEKVVSMAQLLIMNRSSSASKEIPELLQNLSSVRFFDAGDYDFSSRQIREELKQGIDVSSKLPKAVYDYIKENELYR
jgi:nicotinate-nucleotide adenylyltransferase